MMRRLGCLPVLATVVLLVASPAIAAAIPPRAAKAGALVRSRGAAEAALARAVALRSGRGVVTGRELTPALAQLAQRLPALDAGDRRTADRLLARPSDGTGDPQGDGYSVPEHTPFCTAHVCMHWVTSTADAPDLTDTDADGAPDYVEAMAAEFELVRTKENGDFGWRLPISDGTLGGDAGKLDVFLVDLTGTGILGYAATDTGQADAHHKYAYMVMDEDYSDQADPVAVMDVTAAHEYNHVLQFAYDAAQDTWFFEATAVWMEDRVHDAVDHYLGFIPTWATLDEIPLARNYRDKHYGSAVWNMWLDARHGPALIRDAWDGSTATTPQSFAPAAYEAALARGGDDSFAASFTRFIADVAEWRTAAAFPEGAAYTDAQRRGNLQAAGAGVSPLLDHTTYALYTVPQPAGGWPAVLRLDGELPAGVAGGLALVARTGADTTAGTVTTQLVQLPAGGQGSVQLESPAGYGRITAVLVNADTVPVAFQGGDWVFAADGEPFSAAAGVSGAASETPANTTAPSITGVPRDGSRLTAANGVWSGSAPMTYARRWERCDSGGDACADVAGATAAGYTATEDDVGHRLRVAVTGGNGVADVTAESGPTVAVVAVAPTFGGTPPAIDDTTPTVGDTVHSTNGTWNGSHPLVITYQWRRCTTTGLATCSDIGGATDAAYTVAAGDADQFLRVRVTATNTAGSAFRDSAATAKVAAGAPTAPQSSAAPSVTGVANDGETLTAVAGTWTGSPTPSITRVWLRCSGTGVETCVALTGQTGQTLLLGPDDVGSRMRVREHAQNTGGGGDAVSDPTAPVTADAPQLVNAPAVSGTARDGELLTATDGTWTGTAPSFTRRWQRCDGAACADVAGATGSTYRLAPEDIGHALKVIVTASNPAGTVPAESVPTAAVQAIPVAGGLPPTVTGDALQGATLSSQPGSWTGSPPIVITRRWQRCPAGELTCADVAGATGDTYVLGLADVLQRVRVVVTAANAAGPVSVASALTGVIAGAPAAGGGGTPPAGGGGGGGGGQPAPVPAALAATVKAPATGKLAAALAGRLSVRVDCTAACSIAARIELARGAARKLKVSAVLARGTAKLPAAGRAGVKLRFAGAARKRLQRVRKVAATLVVEVRDAAGATVAKRRSPLTLRR